MPILLALMLCWVLVPCQAQILQSPLSQPYSGAVAYSHYQADAVSFYHNPALLALLRQPHFGFSAEQRYFLPGLTAAIISGAVPSGTSRFGFFLQHWGFSEQQNNHAGFSFAQALGKRGSLGATVVYRSLSTAGYGNARMLGVELGGMLQLSPQLQGGFQVFRQAGALGNNGKEQLAAQYSLGLGYDLSQQVFLSAVLQKVEGTAPEVHTSVSYRFTNKISSRLGMHTGTGQYFFGSGFSFGVLQIHVFSVVHPRLGITPGLQMLLGQNKEE